MKSTVRRLNRAILLLILMSACHDIIVDNDSLCILVTLRNSYITNASIQPHFLYWRSTSWDISIKTLSLEPWYVFELMLQFIISPNINQMLRIFKQNANANLVLLLCVELSTQTTQIGVIIVSIDKDGIIRHIFIEEFNE